MPLRTSSILFKPHWTAHPIRNGLSAIILVILFLLVGCSPGGNRDAHLTIPVEVDGQTITIIVQSGQIVQEALEENGIHLADLDQTLPQRDVPLTSNATIIVTRIQETLQTVEEEIPFGTKILPNETMPVGERRIIQNGVNGLREVIYRHLLENGKEISATVIQSSVLREPQDEIVMEGIHSPNTPMAINGRLAYMVAGNAWVMEGSTGNRRALTNSGDLDSHVFELSPDGNWLLFSRRPDAGQVDDINRLSVVNVSGPPVLPFDLGISNVVHFAAWDPIRPRTIVFSSVEPRPTAPGWQANNDLQSITFTEAGSVYSPSEWLTPNSGGVYGWWGASFLWHPAGKLITTLRPDGIHIFGISTKTLSPWIELIPFETHGSWAWVSQACWDRTGNILYAINHRSDSSNSEESSPHFDLEVYYYGSDNHATLREDVGMFAYPLISPNYPSGDLLAYLQATYPLESDTSPYRLMIVDKDGSEPREVFPRQGSGGMSPQLVQWQPTGTTSDQALVSVIYFGNIWIVDAINGSIQQITGDGLTEKISWR